MDERLLSQVEDAGLNASAPPQQRWMDGWLLRFSPGKAKRARCINAVAPGRLPLDEKLRRAQLVFDQAGLPPVVRITRFSQPPSLDADLAARGWTPLDDTRVMVTAHLPPGNAAEAPAPLPAGVCIQSLSHDVFAAAVGSLRGSPPAQVQAHAQRLAMSPVPYQGFALCAEDGSVLACGQLAQEGVLVGLYDVFTHPEHRGRGLAGWLCERMLTLAAAQGADVAYLQVDADNLPARAVYRRLGFVDADGYHYRLAPGAVA